jgi:ArsR family transcriptional regulator
LTNAAGRLSSEQRGTWVYYRVEPAVLIAMGQLLTKAATA